MIAGKVTANRAAVIRLNVIGPTQSQQEVEAVLDTGFNGFLTLASSEVQALELPLAGSRRAILADGSIVALNVHLARVQCTRKNVKSWSCKPKEALWSGCLCSTATALSCTLSRTGKF